MPEIPQNLSRPKVSSKKGSLDKWHRIKKNLRIINKTEKVTVLNDWEKTRLAEGIDFDDIILKEPDNEEEILLQDAMEELMIGSDYHIITKSSTGDWETQNMVKLLAETQKKTKEKQITDLFQSQKSIFP